MTILFSTIYHYSQWFPLPPNKCNILCPNCKKKEKWHVQMKRQKEKFLYVDFVSKMCNIYIFKFWAIYSLILCSFWKWLYVCNERFLFLGVSWWSKYSWNTVFYSTSFGKITFINIIIKSIYFSIFFKSGLKVQSQYLRKLVLNSIIQNIKFDPDFMFKIIK